MLKLYRLDGSLKQYWETWETSPGDHIVHWGELGTRGSTKTIRSTIFRDATTSIQEEIDDQLANGFAPIEAGDHVALIIEYEVDGMGTASDVEKRFRLENRMNETLGWTGLGACDGGSIGSGTMEVCNFVVDFEIAKRVIEEDLAKTEFSDYWRIYDERA